MGKLIAALTLLVVENMCVDVSMAGSVRAVTNIGSFRNDLNSIGRERLGWKWSRVVRQERGSRQSRVCHHLNRRRLALHGNLCRAVSTKYLWIVRCSLHP